MRLDKSITPETFAQTYWLKAELEEFCRLHKIPTSGSKADLANKIKIYLSTGEIIAAVKSSGGRQTYDNEVSLDKVISANYRSDQLHRSFFLSHIPKFKYNVAFMNWMKANKSIKKYSDAINEYNRIISLKDSGHKPDIAPQFKYNKYTRDFFAANPGLSRADCIKCWNYKKNIPGDHQYEPSDLEILNN